MKYKVKFKCYHYERGNKSHSKLFNSLDEAQSFKRKADEESDMYEKYFHLNMILKEEFDDWRRNFYSGWNCGYDAYCIGKAKIFEYHSAVEIVINE